MLIKLYLRSSGFERLAESADFYPWDFIAIPETGVPPIDAKLLLGELVVTLPTWAEAVPAAVAAIEGRIHDTCVATSVAVREMLEKRDSLLAISREGEAP